MITKPNHGMSLNPPGEVGAVKNKTPKGLLLVSAATLLHAFVGDFTPTV
jgi:hypothetical protein